MKVLKKLSIRAQFKKIKEWFKKNKNLLIFSSYVLSTVVLGSWIADTVKGDYIFSSIGKFTESLLFRIVLLLIFIALFYYIMKKLYEFRKNLSLIRVPTQAEIEAHKAIIAVLTDFDEKNFELDFDKEDYDICLKYKNGEQPTSIRMDNDKEEKLKEFINKIKNKWPWQQILRGILQHWDKLSNIIFIPTKETEQYYSKIEHLIHKFLPNVKIEKGNVAKSDDLQLLMNDFDQAISYLKKIEKIKETDIVIDITGGKKIHSIAGAIVTLKRNVTFQYVDTNNHDKIIMFDVTINLSPDFN